MLGYVIKKIGWVTKDDFGIFSNIVLKITIPCSIITSFNEVNIDVSMLIYVFIGILVNMILGGLGFVAGKNKEKEVKHFNIIN